MGDGSLSCTYEMLMVFLHGFRGNNSYSEQSSFVFDFTFKYIFTLSLLKNKGLGYKQMHYTYNLNLQHCKCIAVMMCCVPRGYGIYHLCF